MLYHVWNVVKSSHVKDGFTKNIFKVLTNNATLNYTCFFLVGFKQVSLNYSYLRNIMQILCCSPTIHAVFTLFTLHTRWLLVEKRNECYNTSLCGSLVGYLWTVWNNFTRMLFLFLKTCHLFNTVHSTASIRLAPLCVHPCSTFIVWTLDISLTRTPPHIVRCPLSVKKSA